MAFLIPVIAKILESNHAEALILTPTRELADQIQTVIEKLLYKIKGISSTLLIGGAPIFKQIQKLKQNTNIIVGTPGRITDHLKRKSLNLKSLELLVLDESDRMLDMGFSIQLDDILRYLPSKKQTLMFSATFSSQILGLSRKYLTNPEKIKISSSNAITLKIKQDVIHTSSSAKYKDLSDALDNREGSIIVFVNTKASAEALSKKLLANKHSVSTLHGDIIYRKRER
jgi:superfamily II DNA/RNA helicase